MKATLEKAFGYQGDNMNLPVRDLAAALPFYESVLGFRVLSRGDTPHNSAVLARDQVQIGLAENGGDPTQDGCAFHVKDLKALLAEFNANKLHKESSDFDVERHDFDVEQHDFDVEQHDFDVEQHDFDVEQHDGVAWQVFYVVAPDGLCYWFGERRGD